MATALKLRSKPLTVTWIATWEHKNYIGNKNPE